MPANNPLIGGLHVANWMETAGQGGPAASAAPSEGATMNSSNYRIPVVVLMAFALLFLFLAVRVAGFHLITSASVG